MTTRGPFQAEADVRTVVGMLAGLAEQRLPQVEEYRLNLFRLP